MMGDSLGIEESQAIGLAREKNQDIITFVRTECLQIIPG